ncbi:MAG: Ig-like domain-containing protein [Planctomycetes bacterium]|nr:Ig-like domain-containing protein [Planctomycetota bacterium]
MPSPFRWWSFLFLASVLLAQEPELPRRPADVDGVLMAMPVAATVAEGRKIEVIDAATDQPIAGADVWVVERAVLDPVKKSLREVQRSFAGDADGFARLVAVWWGTRYQSAADGTVTVAAADKAQLLVIAGDRVAEQRVNKWPDEVLTVKLVERKYVTVTVTDAKGKPAADVPVSFGTLWEHSEEHQFFHGFRHAVTDRQGRARVLIQDVQHNQSPAVQVDVLLPKPLRGKIVLDDQKRQQEPLAFQLPPCGMVRVLLYDENEHPLSGLESVGMQTEGASWRALPSKLEADGAMFRWVGLDQQLVIDANVKGLSGALRHTQAGPVRAGEMVVCGVRMTAADPIVRMRVLDAQGEPLRKTAFGLMRVADKSFDGDDVQSDGDGRLQFTVAKTWLAEEGERKVLLVARGHSVKVTEYQGALQVPVDGEAKGIVDLGDVRFAEEPVQISGVVVDGDGKPMPRLIVSTQSSWQHGAHSTSVSGNGRQLFFQHKASTDDQGRFSIRELAPKDVAMPLTIDGGKWVLTEPCSVTPGTQDLKLVVVRGGSLRVELAAARRPDNLQLLLQRAGSDSSQWGYLRDGRCSWEGLVPGRYSLSVSTIGDNAVLLQDLDVKPGEACADPRLQDFDVHAHAHIVRLTVRRPDGKPAANTSVHGVQLRGGGGSASGHSTNDAGVTEFVFQKGGGKITIDHRDYRYVAIDQPPVDCTIDLQERAHVRLRLADGQRLPDGLTIVAEPPSKDWWSDGGKAETVWKNGQDVVLLPDRAGELKLEIRAADGESLWQGKIEVPAGDKVDVTLPLDAAAIADIQKATGGK